MAMRLSAALLAIVLVVLGYRSMFSVPEGESALLTRFGRLETVSYGPGLHLKMPVDRVRRVDQRLITHTYTGDSFLTSDQQALSVEFFVRWRASDIPLFYRTTGGDVAVAGERLADLARDRLKSAVAREPLSAVATRARGGLDQSGFEQLRSAARALGVEVVDLQLQRIDLTDDAADVVYQRMEEQLTTVTQQLDASSTLQADQIRSAAERQRADILADATRQAQHIRTAADAQAAQIYAQAYGRDPELAAFTQSLQAYRDSLGREGDILVITPQGEFFKYLRSAAGTASPGR
jgi:modulator of FtsH protease HflC